jgi:hypothetical protein
VAIIFATFQKALQDAIVSACGLADGKVIWARQDGVRPGLPYLTLSLTPLATLGIDGTRHTYDPGAATGQEITLAHGGPREFGLTVTAFGPTLGTSSAVALLEATKSALNKVAIREALEAANVSIFDFGPILDLSAVEDAAFEGRAVMDLRGYTTQEITEQLGYIGSVETTAVIADVTTIETIDIGSPPPSGVWGSGNVWE